MADVFHIKAGDLTPPLEATLTAANGAVDLSDIGELRFHMALAGAEEATVDAVAEVVDGEAGTVRYQWVEGDTERPGLYRGEFKLRTGGKPSTFPNDGYFLVRIHEGVARDGVSE